MRQCRVPDCQREWLAREMCSLHYSRWRRYGDPLYVPVWSMDEVPRFWFYVRKDAGECWQWTGGVSQSGYGVFATGSRSNDSLRFVNAHRYSFQLAGGEIPDGYQIDHLCRNKLCVRPDHLEAVTPRENTLRGVGPSAKNAVATHCKHGHPFDEANTWFDPKRNTRHCRACARIRARRRPSRAGVSV